MSKPPPIDLETWRRRWTEIGQSEANRPWEYGDLFNQGRQFVKPNLPADEESRQIAALIPALGECGISDRNLRVFGHVAREFPVRARVVAVSWSHHREVWQAGVRTSERAKWLRRAEKRGWSVRDLRVAMAPESRPEKAEPHPVGWVARRWSDEGVRGLRDMFPPDEPVNTGLLIAVSREFADLLDELRRIGLLSVGP